MSNLLSSGVTFALLSADTYSNVATKPMTMVSQELKKRNPDLELVNRAMSYGSQELNKAEKASELAQKEMEQSAKEAKAEKEHEDAVRLEETKQKRQYEREKIQALLTQESVQTTEQVLEGEALLSDDATIQAIKKDMVELSQEALAHLSSTETKTDIAFDRPQIYLETMRAIHMKTTKPRIDMCG